MKIHKLFPRSKNPPLGKIVLLKRRSLDLDCVYGPQTLWTTGYTYKPDKESHHGITCFVDIGSRNLARYKKDIVAWCELPD
jgi:hypothetical protein